MHPVDVRDLLGQPGASRQVVVAEPVEDLATEMARVPPEAPIRVDVLLESVVEGILVSGPVTGEISYRCARCLKPFTARFAVEVAELFSPGARDEEEAYPLGDDGALDLEPMVRDAVILSMPFSPLCRPDCLGLCERCGGDRNLGECNCGPEVDPRWAALGQLELE
jgi:uncharacterized protein